MISIPENVIPWACAGAGAVVLTLVIVWCCYCSCYSELMQSKQIRYLVDPVHPNGVADYQRANPLNPLLDDLVKAVVGNPDLAHQHASLQAAQRRYQAIHVGAVLFVRVLS